MWIFPLVGYLGLAVGFLFLTLAIASGLYYLSELVEEYTVIAKKVLTRLIYGVVGCQVLLVLIDRFPIGLSALSIASHVVYLQNLRRFPIVKLSDPIFITSCVLVLANHWLWFRHFSTSAQHHERSRKDNMASAYAYYDNNPDIPTLTEVAAFFGLMVWLVPFALFVSLSAGDHVLPSMGSEYATGQGSSFVSPGLEPSTTTSSMGDGVGGFSKRHRRSGTNQGLAKVTVNSVREWVGETGEAMGFWKGERTRPV